LSSSGTFSAIPNLFPGKPVVELLLIPAILLPLPLRFLVADQGFERPRLASAREELPLRLLYLDASVRGDAYQAVAALIARLPVGFGKRTPIALVALLPVSAPISVLISIIDWRRFSTSQKESKALLAQLQRD
jgi:hypothetical protein